MILTPVQATCRVRHEKAVAYNQRQGIWQYQLESEEEIKNIVTNKGRVTLHTFIYGSVAQRASAGLGANGLAYIGLSNNAAAPAAGDLVLTAELSGNGLTRTLGTVTLPTGSNTVTTISHTFTYSGVVDQGVQKAALFDAAVAGNMAHEILFTPRTLSQNDTLTFTFSITIA